MDATKNIRESGGCDPSTGCCPPDRRKLDLYRREFLAASLRAAAAAAVGRTAAASPFLYHHQNDENDYLKVIPADKKLNNKWLASLTARGAPMIYKGDALDRIGMPVGGLCAGQMYLSGDGRLWLWDIFNQYQNGVCNKGGDGANYIKPLPPDSPVTQGFAIHIKNGMAEQVRPFDRKSFRNTTFEGRYPIAKINYDDDDSDVRATLECYSPFIPLDAEQSSYPATIFEFTITNKTDEDIKIAVAGYLENAIGLYSSKHHRVRLRNRKLSSFPAYHFVCEAESNKSKTAPRDRKAILIEDFEKDHYGPWRVEGEAFGDRPANGNQGADQHISGFEGKGFVNSYQKSDAPKGKLISPEFAVERDYINFLIGGGNHPKETCIQLIVGGAVVRSSTPNNSDTLDWLYWDVREFDGETARIEIVDLHSGGWGHIDIDTIEMADSPKVPRGSVAFEEEGDFGTLALGLLDYDKSISDTFIHLQTTSNSAEGSFRDISTVAFSTIERTGGLGEGFPLGRPVGSIRHELELKADETRKVAFALTWHFPNLKLPGFQQKVGRAYAARFKNAEEVLFELQKKYDELSTLTKRWRDTWYDSTLPYWFLDRTFANISTLATSTAHWFENGRFWAWEGVGCCHGTCTHVWHYAWGVGRLFPQFEKLLRERVEFGEFFDDKTGIVAMRGEFDKSPAVDGQCGVILRIYRDHEMSEDGAFLTKHWPRVRKAIEYLINRDVDRDGIVDGDQPNTLDAAWFGKIAWISNLYLAALRAGEEMAVEMGDAEFAQRCNKIVKIGSEKIVKELFNGEFFIQIPDPKHSDAIGADAGCYIDQVFGQSWAHHVGLGRILPKETTRAALDALWKYNFVPDVGPFREKFKEGRNYALAGDAGLVMCTWPKGGKRDDWKKHWQYMYFNECMSGFEHQAAAHMLWEGMITEGLSVERAIHDRYHARFRNPYNEIECGDHYARAMASYGVFTAACGFEVHGPKLHIGFAPAFSADDFKAPFTAPRGWGTFIQKRGELGAQKNSIIVRHGSLTIKTCYFSTAGKPETCRAAIDGAAVDCNYRAERDGVIVEFAEPKTLTNNQQLEIQFQ